MSISIIHHNLVWQRGFLYNIQTMNVEFLQETVLIVMHFESLLLSIYTSPRGLNWVIKFCSWSALSQTTNFRLFQTERICRQQFWTEWKRQKVLQMDRKHCGKRRNCSLRAISPFPAVFFKTLVLQTRKNQGLFGKRLISRNWTFLLNVSIGGESIGCQTNWIVLNHDIVKTSLVWWQRSIMDNF